MAGKIRNYTFYNSNLSAGQLREIKPFIAKVEKFAKFALPRMGEEIKLYCEVAAVVGEGIVADLYIYGYNQMYEDQFEFERVNTKKSMADQVRGIVKAFIGGQPSVEASAYWRSRLHIAGKEKLIGPYVEVEYFGDAMDAFVDIDIEIESRGVDKLVNNILEGHTVRSVLSESVTNIDTVLKEKLFKITDKLGWVLSAPVRDNTWGFFIESPKGRRFAFTVDAIGLEDLIGELTYKLEEFDVCTETYKDLDKTGHGKNGAPYDMQDIYNENVWILNKFAELVSAISKLR